MLINSNTFNSRQGHLITNPYDAVYDDNGWLWILGEKKSSSPYTMGENEVIIERFDGANFFPLRISYAREEKIRTGRFFKHKNQGLYLELISQKGVAQLFYIDTQTLEVNSYQAFSGFNDPSLTYQEYHQGDQTRLIISSKNKVYSAEIDELELRLLDSISFKTQLKKPHLSNIIATDDITIATFKSELNGVLVDAQGKILRQLSSNEFFNSQGENIYPTAFQNHIRSKSTDYFYLEGYENLFKYQEGQFVELPGTAEQNSINRDLIFNKEFTLAYSKEIVSDYREFKLYSFRDLKPELLAKLEIKNFSKIAFKALGKDLVVLHGNLLSTYSFNDSKIKTFLKGKSVRSIKQVDGNTYLVATDSEGFYLVDIDSNTERLLRFNSNGSNIPILYPRDIIVQEDGSIIIGSLNRLYTLNTDYQVLSNQTARIVGEEIIKVGDTIFNTGRKGSIYKYSIQGDTNIKVENTQDLLVKEFATDGNNLFAVTNKGLLEYLNGTFTVTEFEGIPSEDLLSIAHSDSYGIILSTRYGQLYTFDTKKQKLDLIYEDPLEASIVGIVEDWNNNLWLNTYAGIVSLDVSKKRTSRFTNKDGVYELEGNRFSSYIDPDGNIFMGSYKGLSFFNPEELSPSEIQVQPRFTSISFFNSQEGRWEVHTSPEFLENTKSIILPAEYRRFSVTASVFDGINPQDLNYRYRLANEGSNSDWFTSYAGRELLYANLAPGRYLLQIEVFDASNNKLGETLELEVISEQVFYKSWWFILLSILIVAGISIYFFNQYRIKQKLFAKNEMALKEASIKNSMMLEIHHRIKNNLQIVSALLEIQMADSNNEHLKSILEKSQSRIESIAGIHEVLYSSDNQSSVIVENNIQNIINYYKKLFVLNINYEAHIDQSILPIDQATPFTLLLNELIYNSNKHAFDTIDHPKITIKFYRKNKEYYFEYFDNGIFKREDPNKKNMGMRIVSMMIKQLKGSVTVSKDSNFSLTLVFPIHE